MQAPASPPWDIATSKKRKSSITSPRPSLPSTPVGSSLVIPRDEDGFTKVMTKEQRRKLKKVAKKTNLEAHERPQFQFNTQGFQRKIGVAHIRDFVIHLITGQGQPPNWIVAQNRTNIAHTLVLLVPGILPEHLGLPPVPPSAMLPFATSTSQYIPGSETARKATSPTLPIIPKLFSYACPVRAPGDSRRLHSALTTLVMSAIPDNEKSRRKKEKEKAEAEKRPNPNASSDPSIYLLTADEMVDNDYRLPSYMTATGSGSGSSRNHNMINVDGNGKGKAREEDWVETPERDGKGDWRVLAIDCEMCLSEDGQELARISCVDYETGKNVFDALVKPPKPIVDYLTQWSGITAESLATATHTLSTIQKHLLDPANNLITPNTILLGHSLECDLSALRIKHPYCIDTSVIFQHPKGPPYKQGLKFLAGRFLNRDIQNSTAGHDSEEDAQACVDLLKAKLANGPDFGVVPQETESIFERLARNQNTTLVCDYGNPATWYGAKATTVVQAESDDEVLQGLKANVGKHELSFGRLMGLQRSLGWSANKVTAAAAAAAEEEAAASPSEALSKLNDQLTDLYQSLPRQTAVVLLTGHADPVPMLALNARRQQWEREVRTVGISKVSVKWTAEDERELESAVMQAREGIALFCVR